MTSTSSLHPPIFSEVMSEPLTLIDLLRQRAQRQPDQRAYIFLTDGETEEITLDYYELDRQARAIGASLKPLVTTGDRVLLLYPPGLEYIAAFFGCLYAGAVAVPAYPPRHNRNLLRLQTLVNDAQAAIALTTTQILSRIAPQFSQNPYLEPLRWLTSDKIAEGAENSWQEPAINGDALAFLQYTSGSTSAPKGVMLSHRNLLHNEHLIQRVFRQTAESIIVGWLPLYHDMGLIGNVIQPLFVGAPCVLMSPVAFLQKPFRWLKAISRYRGTTSGGPNFAYDLCVRKINDEQRAQLDLSSWRLAFNGAEPLRAETLERFADAFAPCGFRLEDFAPCYGLAEATLLVSGRLNTQPPVVKTVQARALENNCVVEVNDGDNSRPIVGCGSILMDQEIVIVRPDTLTKCLPHEVGEIWVSGPSIAQGYWNLPEETNLTFKAHLSDTGQGPFLRTGDLGFLQDGELFVTGRLKDLIIIRGLNHYPQDIELTVEKCDTALRAGCGAAFSVEVAGEERLVIIQEIDRLREPDAESLFERIGEAVSLDHELQAHALVLIKAGSIPKTSSGKIQRHACRAAFLESRLDVLAERREEVETRSETTIGALASWQSVEAVEIWLHARLAAKLGVDLQKIDVMQPIARYGLDSLTALELVHSMEDDLGITLPFTLFLENHSIAQLAGQVFAWLQAGSSIVSQVGTRPNRTEAIHPLSSGQQALWFLHQVNPTSTAYNMLGAVRILSEVNAMALRRAFQGVVNRHPALRTTFKTVEGKPVQQIHERVEISFDEQDASAWSEESLRAYLIKEGHRPFSLEQGPLLRVTLCHQSREKHVLLLAMHHIISDFWSLAVFIHELGVLYESELAGRQAQLTPLTLQYTDYVRWQEEMLESAEGERLYNYWQRQLAGELPSLDFLTDKPRPPVKTSRGSSQNITLNAQLTHDLKALGQCQGATLYMTLLAAFQILLHRYTQQTDIVVGSPTAGRSRAELAGLIGYFVNPVALRANLAGDPSFEDFLAQVRRTVLDALTHQDYPFALLVERLQPERDPSRSPFFQVMFVLQKANLLNGEGLAAFALDQSGARMMLGELTLESMTLEDRIAQFDLTLTVTEVDEGLTASLVYDTDLFDDSSISRLLAHFSSLLSSIISSPLLPVSRLPLLSSSDLHLLLHDWNSTSSPLPPLLCLHHLFQAQVARAPHAPALLFHDQLLSFAQLNSRANQLAHHLLLLGVTPDLPVALCLDRSLDLFVALLAILKAGAAYLPLDPNDPLDRLSFILDDAAPSLLLTHQRWLDLLPAHSAQVLCLDTDWPLISAHSEQNPTTPTDPHNLAYIMYTSGSTGTPKAVMVTHRNVLRLVMQSDYVHFGDSEVFLQLAPICFDAATFEVWGSLLHGARLVVMPPGMPSLEQLGAALVEHGVTTLWLTAGLFHLVAEEQPGLFSTVRQVVAGGDVLSVSAVERVLGVMSAEGRLVNGYGPTESTTFTCCHVMRAGEEVGRSVPIGRPIANTQVYILDGQMQLVPVGVAGELYIGGEGVGRGYWQRPALTAERFVPHPYESGARLYRSGDLARHLADGRVEFLGRMDRQVKVRGYRIELGEVEAVLCRHAAVKEAVVEAVEGEGGVEKRLVAYVVAEAESEQRELWRELSGYLKERLPEYMVPVEYVEMVEMPLTRNGKVDRRVLAERREQRVTVESGYVGPRSITEEIVAGMWAEVLGQKRVGMEEEFFELGGHSLLATQVMSRVREVFGVEVGLRRMFERTTVRGLAEEIEEEMKRGEGKKRGEMRRLGGERGEGGPLSFGQQRLWFLDQMEAGSSFYNVGTALRLRGELKVGVLEQTLSEIVRRHEVLRTSFPEVEGLPIQLVAPHLGFTIPLTDLSEMGESERESEAQRLAEEEAERPFDLSRGPLLRASLLRLGEVEHIMVLTMHHIISDGWSVGVLIREVGALYEAYSEGRESPLEELPVQYGDYAVWQREWLQGEVLEQQIGYWKEQLRGAAEVLKLPTDRPRPAVQSYRGGQHRFEVMEEVSEKLKELSRREGVTLFMTLLAAFQVQLHYYSQQAEIVVGTNVANRNRAETEGLIGFFVNTLVLRSDLSGDPSFREVLKRVREVCLGAYGHQDVPFEKLVEVLQPERDVSRSPLFQVKIEFGNNLVKELSFQRSELDSSEIGTGVVRYDLHLFMMETDQQLIGSLMKGLSLSPLKVNNKAAKSTAGPAEANSSGGLIGALEYNTGLFDADTVARMIELYKTLLQRVETHPDEKLSVLTTLLGEADKQLQQDKLQLDKKANLQKLKNSRRRFIRESQPTESI